MVPWHFFSVWTVCVSFDGSHFSFNFWEAASIVSLGGAKIASFLRSNFGFEFGAKVCLFWSLWQVIPDWLVLEARMRAERVAAALLWFYKHDSGS